MKRKLTFCIVSLMWGHTIFSQESFAFISIGSFYKNTVQRTNENTGDISNSDPEMFGFPDLACVGTFDANFYFKLHGTGLEAMIVPTSKPYNLSLLDCNFGKNFNAKRPISLGPVDIRLGMGVTAGFKFFSYKHSYLSYGLTFHSMINVGENFQILYINTLAPGFNKKYDKIGRTANEFYIMYNINKLLQISLCPYIEKYHYVDTDELDIAVKNKFLGLKLGFCGTIKY